MEDYKEKYEEAKEIMQEKAAILTDGGLLDKKTF